MRAEQLTLFDVAPFNKNNVRIACLSVGDFAKVLASKSFNVGEVRLFAKMRDWRMIDKFNIPYQKYIEAGYFKIIAERYFRGSVAHVHKKILVTHTGQKYIEERLKNETDGNMP